MAIKSSQVNLGHKVTTRTINFQSMVEEAWGEQWNKPYDIYKFSNGRKFKDSNRGDEGIYNKTNGD